MADKINTSSCGLPGVLKGRQDHILLIPYILKAFMAPNPRLRKLWVSAHESSVSKAADLSLT